MPRSQPLRCRLAVEVLEDRLNFAPVLFAQFELPGAGRVWDDGYRNGNYNPSPIFADVTGDGVDELLAVGGDGAIHAYQFSAGRVRQVQTYSTGRTDAIIQGTPTAVLLPGNIVGIFAGTAALSNPTPAGPPYLPGSGLVFGWNAATGALLPGWPRSINAPPGFNVGPDNAIRTSIGVGDLTGEGVPEIIAASTTGQVVTFLMDGTELWRFNNDDTVVSTPLVVDLNGDGRNEVIIGGDSSASSTYRNGGRLTALSDSGRRLWVKATDQILQSDPVAVDLNGDGLLEIVIGTAPFYGFAPGFPGVSPFPGNLVFAVDFNGRDLPGWPHVLQPNTVNGQPQSSPAVGDLDGDGVPEVVIADMLGRIYAIRANGTRLWDVRADLETPIFGTPILADTNGDGRADVITLYGPFLDVRNGSTGQQIFRTTLGGNFACFNTAAVGNFRGNGSHQLALVSNVLSGQGPGSIILAPSRVFLYDLDRTPLSPPWPLKLRDASANRVIRSDNFNRQLITSLYNGVLLRPPTIRERDEIWLPIFRKAPSLKQAVLGIISSREARGIQINDFYNRFLNRGVEPFGFEAWQGFLAAGNSYAAMQAAILGSEEFFQRNGGTIPSFVTALYRVLLGRTPANNEEAGWLFLLNNGLLDRTGVARGFLTSEEDTLNFVLEAYRFYRPGGRSTPAPDALALATFHLRRGALEEQVLANILASAGDYPATTLEGSFLRAIYLDLLQRPISAAEVVAWTNLMERDGLPLQTISDLLVRSSEYFAAVTRDGFRRLLGRLPSAGEQQTIVAQLSAGARFQDFLQALASSDEFFGQAGGNLQRFIELAYDRLLDRRATASEVQFWLDLANRANLRILLPQTIVNGPEYHEHVVDLLFFQFLRRFAKTPTDQSRVVPPTAPNPAQGFIAALGAGVPETALVNIILDSPEYLDLVLDKALWLGDRWLDARHP